MLLVTDVRRPCFLCLCLLLEPVAIDTSSAALSDRITATSDSPSIVSAIMSCSFDAFVSSRLVKCFICFKV